MNQLSDSLMSLICCPRCYGALTLGDHLRCDSCNKEYPIVSGIPDLMVDTSDPVSAQVRQFYEWGWQPNHGGAIRAKEVHEDTSVWSQAGIARAEAAYQEEFNRGGAYFLDAGCGAQPREAFGRNYRRHVCLDMDMGGLLACREQLGERAMCIRGSLLRAPIRDRACDAVFASHCIYHIEEDLQSIAFRELMRVAASSGKLVILYANPGPLKRPRLRLVELADRWTTNPGNSVPGWDGAPLYVHLHSIERVIEMLTEAGAGEVKVRPLQVFSQSEIDPLLRSPLLGRILHRLTGALESWVADPRKSYFLCYAATRTAAEDSICR